MQLIILASALSSVFSQKAVVRSINGPMQFTGFNRCDRIQGTAISVETDNKVIVQLFKGRDCGKGAYAWATGNYNFRQPYDFQSIRLVPSSNQRSASANGPQALQDGGQGGEDQASLSYYEVPNYYYYGLYNDIH